MTLPSKKTIAWSVLLVMILLGIGAAATKLLRQARAASDYSVHAALTSEVCERLAAIQPGQSYPASLSELRLTFPDGGDTSMLSRFTYTSGGTNCALRTVLRGEEIVRLYP